MIRKSFSYFFVRTQNTNKIRKWYENPDFCIIFVFFFFCILVSGEDSGCILGCILGSEGFWHSAQEIATLSITNPEGPKIEKFQDFAPGLKLSSDQSRIEIFNRDWKFQASHTARPLFVGIIKVGIEIFRRDWTFQSRLKISSLDWNFQAYGLKISRDQSGLILFNRWALWEVLVAPDLLLVVLFRRRTNVQQLTCNIDLSRSFYYLFFSFALLELALALCFEGESPGGKIMKKCEKFWKSVKNYEMILPFSCCPLVFPWLWLALSLRFWDFSSFVQVGARSGVRSLVLHKCMQGTVIGNENSAQSFSDRSFWKSLRGVDVRAFGSWMSVPKCLFFQGFRQPWPKFWAGISARMTPGCPRNVRPENFLFGLIFRSGSEGSSWSPATRSQVPLLRDAPLWVYETARVQSPDLPFLASLDFLAFFVARNFLVFWGVFPFFPRDFRGSAQRKNPCFFWVVFLAFLGFLEFLG